MTERAHHDPKEFEHDGMCELINAVVNEKFRSFYKSISPRVWDPKSKTFHQILKFYNIDIFERL